MTAQRLTNGELDAAIYGTPPTLVLLPRPSVPLLCAVNPRWITIPHSALEKAPTEVLPSADSKPLPIDEKPEPLGFCLNWEAAKLDGLLAMHKFTARTKLRIPMGQRVLSPLHCRWSSVQQDFVYSFQIMENATKWYVESELVEVKGE